MSPRATQSFHLASGRPLPGVPASANLVTLTFSKADASTYSAAADALRQREEEATAAEAEAQASAEASAQALALVEPPSRDRGDRGDRRLPSPSA